MPIARVDIDAVDDPFAAQPDGVLFRIRLNTRPPAQWVRLLDEPGGTFVPGWDPPTYNVPETALEITSSPEGFPRWLAELDRRITSANMRYETEVLPRQKAQQREADGAEARRQANLADARRVIEDLERRAG